LLLKTCDCLSNSPQIVVCEKQRGFKWRPNRFRDGGEFDCCWFIGHVQHSLGGLQMSFWGVHSVAQFLFCTFRDIEIIDYVQRLLNDRLIV
jgi:hypothetical protein